MKLVDELMFTIAFGSFSSIFVVKLEHALKFVK